MAQPIRLARFAALPHQADFVEDVHAPIVVLTGGLRAGKTYAAVLKAVSMAMRSSHPILVVEPTYQMMRDVFVRACEEILTQCRIPYRWHRTEHIFSIGRARRRELVCRSLDRPERMIGFTAGGAVVDEWESCTEEGIQRVRERITDVHGEGVRQLALVGSAEGFGFGYRWCEEAPLPGLRVIRARTLDNPYVSRSYVDGVRAMLSDADARERLEGIRTQRGGTVYSRFDRAVHCAAPCVERERGHVEVWADFNVETMAWLLVRVDDKARRAHVFGEIIGHHTDTIAHSERTAHAIADAMSRERGRTVSRDEVRAMRIPIVCDASGAARSAVVPLSHVAVLMSSGFAPLYAPANPRVEDRIASVQMALAERRLTIDAKAAPYAVRCLQAQPYDRSGAPSKDPKLGLDHGADAIGYGVHWHWPTWAPRPNDARHDKRIAA